MTASEPSQTVGHPAKRWKKVFKHKKSTPVALFMAKIPFWGVPGGFSGSRRPKKTHKAREKNCSKTRFLALGTLDQKNFFEKIQKIRNKNTFYGFQGPKKRVFEKKEFAKKLSGTEAFFGTPGPGKPPGIPQNGILAIKRATGVDFLRLKTFFRRFAGCPIRMRSLTSLGPHWGGGPPRRARKFLENFQFF